MYAPNARQAEDEGNQSHHLTESSSSAVGGHRSWTRTPMVGKRDAGAVLSSEQDVVTFCSSVGEVLRDELLSAVYVVGRSGEGGVGHDVNGECGDVARPNDPTDR